MKYFFTNSCSDKYTCAVALHSSNETDVRCQECFLYETVGELKQVEKSSKLVYMVKVPKGTDQIWFEKLFSNCDRSS